MHWSWSFVFLQPYLSLIYLLLFELSMIPLYFVTTPFFKKVNTISGMQPCGSSPGFCKIKVVSGWYLSSLGKGMLNKNTLLTNYSPNTHWFNHHTGKQIHLAKNPRFRMKANTIKPAMMMEAFWLQEYQMLLE